MRVEIGGETRVAGQFGKLTIGFKRVEYALTLPPHFAIDEVARHHQRQLALRLNGQVGVISDIDAVAARGHTDTDLAAGILKRRKLRFQTAQQCQPRHIVEQPGRVVSIPQRHCVDPFVTQAGRCKRSTNGRQRQFAQCPGIGDPGRRQDRILCCRSPQNRDSRIGDHIGMKRFDAFHVDEMAEMERLGNLAAQRPAVLVLQPPVCADETKHTPGSQQVQRALVERHVQVGPVIERVEAAPVLVQQRTRNAFLPHIGWIADDHVESFFKPAEKEVVTDQPCNAQGLRIGGAQARFPQQLFQTHRCGSVAGWMQFDRAHRVP